MKMANMEVQRKKEKKKQRVNIELSFIVCHTHLCTNILTKYYISLTNNFHVAH
jgi:hypothetical protein